MTTITQLNKQEKNLARQLKTEFKALVKTADELCQTSIKLAKLHPKGVTKLKPALMRAAKNLDRVKL